MGNGFDAASGAAAFPDDGIGTIGRFNSRALVNAIKHFEEVAVLLFLSDFQQIEILCHERRTLVVDEKKLKGK